MGFRLKHLRCVRGFLVGVKKFIYVRIFGMEIDKTAQISLSAKLDMTNPKGVHIGAFSYVAFDAAILTHDLTRGVRRHTRIGRNCFIGARSIILPGVEIGDGSIVGAGAVVVKSVPSACIVAGNPAKVIREGIDVGAYGRLTDANEIQQKEMMENGLD